MMVYLGLVWPVWPEAGAGPHRYGSPMKNPPGPREFATTHWSLVVAGTATDVSQTALERRPRSFAGLAGIRFTSLYVTADIQRTTPRT